MSVVAYFAVSAEVLAASAFASLTIAVIAIFRQLLLWLIPYRLQVLQSLVLSVLGGSAAFTIRPTIPVVLTLMLACRSSSNNRYPPSPLPCSYFRSLQCGSSRLHML
jgi:hypothetical protein